MALLSYTILRILDPAQKSLLLLLTTQELSAKGNERVNKSLVSLVTRYH